MSQVMSPSDSQMQILSYFGSPTEQLLIPDTELARPLAIRLPELLRGLCSGVDSVAPT